MSDSIDNLTDDVEKHLLIEGNAEIECPNSEKERSTRKSSTSSNTSSNPEKLRIFHRNNSEIKIEAIFKELFSPDARIIDHYETDQSAEPIFKPIPENVTKSKSIPTFPAAHQNSSKTSTRGAAVEKSKIFQEKLTNSRAKFVETKKNETKRNLASSSPNQKIQSTVKNEKKNDKKSPSPFSRRNAIPLRHGLSTSDTLK